MSREVVQQRNARYHILEGALYLSTSALLAPQTLMPALIKRLGGNDVLVGAWPVVVYLAFFLPQVFSANYTGIMQFRKRIVIQRGFIQRMHIFLLACSIGFWGSSAPFVALMFMFILYISNQMTSGSISPVWMDFLAKTTSPEKRGKLIGWRTSLGAAIGLLNSFILTALLVMLPFPLNYASIIGLAFIFQMSSLLAQRSVAEVEPSVVSSPVQIKYLFQRIQTIIFENRIFRKFLFSAALLTISFTSVAFITVAAMQRCEVNESTIGIFTILTIIGQIISGVLVGWLADIRGTKIALLICAASLLSTIGLAIIATSVILFYVSFILIGINIGAELALRYNFAIECAPEGDRQMYVGLMNAWLAPFYIITPFAGIFSALYGYNSIFVISLFIGVVGFIQLLRVPDPRIRTLALSSK